MTLLSDRVLVCVAAVILALQLLFRGTSSHSTSPTSPIDAVRNRVDQALQQASIADLQAQLSSMQDQVRRLSIQLENRDISLRACDARARLNTSPLTGSLMPRIHSIEAQDKQCRSVAVPDRDDDAVVCVQRAPTLTIVMPFPPKQLNFVQDNLNAWQSFEFYPCDPAKAYGANVDLMFYLSQPDKPTQQALTKAFFNTTWARECFSTLSFKFIDMDAKTDVYGPGTLAMFYSSFDEDFFHRPRDYMLWCEPDFVPIRRHWLDLLYERELVGVPPFWMRGSIPRYPHSDGDWHLNGNALYAVGNRTFAAFAKSSRGAFKAYDSFDQSLFAKMGENRHLAHLFVYTDAIQNRGYEIYDIPQLRANESRLLIAHGKGLLASVKRFYLGENGNGQ